LKRPILLAQKIAHINGFRVILEHSFWNSFFDFYRLLEKISHISKNAKQMDLYFLQLLEDIW